MSQPQQLQLLEQVDPSSLVTLGDNIRRDLGDLSELTDSIRELGVVLQPPLVRRNDAGELEVVAGHRRVAAATAAGVPISVLCGDYDDHARYVAMLTENLQRVDLSPLEEAEAYARLAELGESQRDLARFGRSQSHISKRLSLLKLPEKARAALDSGGITVGQAEDLAKVRDDKVVEQLAKKAQKGDGNLDWEIRAALRKQQADEDTAKARAEVARLQLIEISNPWTEAPEGKRFRQADENEVATHARIISSGELLRYLLEDDTDDDEQDDDEQDDDELTPEEAAARADHEAAQAAIAAQRQAEADAHERRMACLKSIVGSRPNPKTAQPFINDALVASALDDNGVVDATPSGVADLIGVPYKPGQGWDAGTEELRAFAAVSASASMRIALAFALLDIEDALPGARTYARWENVPAFTEKYFAFLQAHGYELADVEHDGLEAWKTEQARADAGVEEPPDDLEEQPPMDLDEFLRVNDVRPGDEVTDTGVVYDPEIVPFDGYDDMTEAELVALLSKDMTPGLLQRILVYEAAHQDRPMVRGTTRALVTLQAAASEHDDDQQDDASDVDEKVEVAV